MTTMTKKTKTQKEHYVNNKEFLAAMIGFKESVQYAEKNKLERNNKETKELTTNRETKKIPNVTQVPQYLAHIFKSCIIANSFTIMPTFSYV